MADSSFEQFVTREGHRWVSKPCDVTEVSGFAFATLAREPLSDPMRPELLSVVPSHTGSDACVCDLSAGIDLTHPTISRHLKMLRTARLLESQRRGSWLSHRVVTDALQQLSQLLVTETLVGSQT